MPRPPGGHDLASAGRAGLLGPAFPGDDGGADPELRGWLERLSTGAAGRLDVLRALATARVFVPVAAARIEDAGTSAPTDDDLVADKHAEMSLLTVAGRDGRRALPVFTSGEAFAAWGVDARPVAVEGARAARTAVDDGAAAMLVDPWSAHRLVVTGPELDQLAAVWSQAAKMGSSRPEEPEEKV